MSTRTPASGVKESRYSSCSMFNSRLRPEDRTKVTKIIRRKLIRPMWSSSKWTHKDVTNCNLKYCTFATHHTLLKHLIPILYFWEQSYLSVVQYLKEHWGSYCRNWGFREQLGENFPMSRNSSITSTQLENSPWEGPALFDIKSFLFTPELVNSLLKT